MDPKLEAFYDAGFDAGYEEGFADAQEYYEKKPLLQIETSTPIFLVTQEADGREEKSELKPEVLEWIFSHSINHALTEYLKTFK